MAAHQRDLAHRAQVGATAGEMDRIAEGMDRAAAGPSGKEEAGMTIERMFEEMQRKLRLEADELMAAEVERAAVVKEERKKEAAAGKEEAFWNLLKQSKKA